MTIASDLVAMLRGVRGGGLRVRWVPFAGSVKAPPLLIEEMAVSGVLSGNIGDAPSATCGIVRSVVTFAADSNAPVKEEIVTKAEFVDQVAERSGIGKGEAAKAVDAVLDTVKEVLSRGGEVNFTGFGKFAVADRGARQGVNPQTGERIQIAASRVPRFSAGSALKKAVKGS